MLVSPEPNTNQRKSKMLIEASSNVRSGLGLFALALKNFALYPESNQIRQQSLLAFHRWLAAFLEDFEKLHLDVERGRLLLVSEIVYQDKPDEQALVYPLFRDGIQWFEFTENVTPEEIGHFINLFNRFRILKEEASDDLATALWEADFTHIKYKTIDDYWESDPMADIAALRSASEESQDTEAVAYIRSGSDTVGYVLRALSKAEDQAGEGDTAGLPPGMHLHPGGQAGLKGLEETIEALEGFLSGEPEGGSGAETGRKQAAGSGPETEDSQTLFMEILSTLEGPDEAKNKQPLAGALAPEGQLKPRASEGPVVIEESSAHGALLTPSIPTDDNEDDDLIITDSAAKSSFTSTYFKSAHSEYLWPLDPSEEQQLRGLIAAEARRNFTQDCLDILMVLVDNSQNLPEIAGVFDFLADEVQYALSQGDFYYISNFIEELSQHVASNPESLASLSDEFLQKIITPEVLGTLSQGWPDHQLTDKSLAELHRFLLLLPPEAINTLVPVLSKAQDQRIEKALLEVIAEEIGRTSANVLPLIGTLKMSALLELISIFRVNYLNLPCPTALLVGLSRHESTHVREESTRALIERQPESLKHLLHLIDDSELAINTLICMQLAKQRSPLVEKVLFDYLSDTYYEKKSQPKEHVLNCYWAFGNCASAQSLLFLQEILLKKDWKSLLGFDGHWHRLGAAMALMLMPEEWGTREVLQEARSSRFKNIRQACQLAEDELRDYRRRAGEH